MRLLVLGGSVFVGRHLVAAAHARGDEVSVFNRGRTLAPQPGTTSLVGDRDGGLDALRTGEWDVVVDTCGFVPRIVRQSAELLAGRVGRYIFVSSISAFADFSAPGLTEAAPRAELTDATSEDVQADYGALKAACEDVVAEVYGARGCSVRPGLIVGPHDPTGRFTYWPTRVADGGAILAPGSPGRPVQFVDARDLVEWILRLGETGGSGTYNAVAPPTTFGELVAVCVAVAGTTPDVVWVEDDVLVEAAVEPWTDLPLWLPGAEHRGLMEIDASRAWSAGLTARPLAATVRDTLQWAQALDGEPLRQADGRYAVQTLTREREAELLAGLA